MASVIQLLLSLQVRVSMVCFTRTLLNLLKHI